MDKFIHLIIYKMKMNLHIEKYHLQGFQLERGPRTSNWVCEACEASVRGSVRERGSKRHQAPRPEIIDA